MYEFVRYVIEHLISTYIYGNETTEFLSEQEVRNKFNVKLGALDLYDFFSCIYQLNNFYYKYLLSGWIKKSEINQQC